MTRTALTILSAAWLILLGTGIADKISKPIDCRESVELTVSLRYAVYRTCKGGFTHTELSPVFVRFEGE